MSSRKLRRAALGLGLSLLVLILIEGASSTLLFVWDLYSRYEAPIQERHHTVHDPLLGWVNLPDVHAPDLYSEGADFTSDARGFRGRRELTTEVPPGRLRVVCAGDSFTLGYGVDDDDTWPARLEAQRGDLQVVNMGQGGYGVDQAWLWYRRDGLAVEHDLVILAFIGDDFERMRKDTFLGYAKPLLELVDGRPEVGNAPVPRGSLRFPRLTQNVKLLQRLRVLELLTRAAGKLGLGGREEARLDEDSTRALSEAIFFDLRESAAQRGARAVLVSLPNLDHEDLSRLVDWPPYARAACAAAAESGIPWIDLAPEFAALDDAERRELFIPKGVSRVPGAAGHYSALGNEFVAAALLRRLEAAGLLERP